MASTASPLTAVRDKKGAKKVEEQVFVASQWKLMWLHFKRHRLAMIGSAVVILLYLMSIFHGFLAPYEKGTRSEYIHMAPQRLVFRNSEGKFSLRPHVYGVEAVIDSATFSRIYAPNPDVLVPVNFFVKGDTYSFLGLFTTDVHLFGVEEGTIFLMGTDELGRCLFSRVLYGSSISLSIGLVGVFLSFTLGAILGGVSGFYGGVVDTVIQRIIELLISIPTIPLWMALSAAVPQTWTALQVYFAITIILSLSGWAGLARVVRGRLLELREEDFVMAAKLSGSSDWRIITRHLLPAFLSYLIVNMTLAIPNMILGETALSFLGLGLRPPVVSWGVLLQKAQNVRAVSQYPWLMLPGIFVIVTVLAFNFMGDGLRDAADPYKS
ncbi:MAG: ABC transporter permease [Anaerolineae bacterium]|jgi:peptide/nickel transport system permease protein